MLLNRVTPRYATLTLTLIDEINAFYMVKWLDCHSTPPCWR